MDQAEQLRNIIKMNNHIFAISPEGGYMWASEGRIGFV